MLEKVFITFGNETSIHNSTWTYNSGEKNCKEQKSTCFWKLSWIRFIYSELKCKIVFYSALLSTKVAYG